MQSISSYQHLILKYGYIPVLSLIPLLYKARRHKEAQVIHESIMALNLPLDISTPEFEKKATEAAQKLGMSIDDYFVDAMKQTAKLAETLNIPYQHTIIKTTMEELLYEIEEAKPFGNPRRGDMARICNRPAIEQTIADAMDNFDLEYQKVLIGYRKTKDRLFIEAQMLDLVVQEIVLLNNISINTVDGLNAFFDQFKEELLEAQHYEYVKAHDKLSKEIIDLVKNIDYE